MAIRRAVDVCDEEWLEVVRENRRDYWASLFDCLRLAVVALGFLSLLSWSALIFGYAVGWLA